MDRISSTSNDDVIEAEFNSKSPSDSLPNSNDSFSKFELKDQRGDEDKKTSQLISLKMERTCIRPMNNDDIISKELPYTILDTDVDGKDEDSASSAESDPLDVPNSTLSDEPNQPCKETLDEQFKADIIEQDTGYSSDAAENVKSCSSENMETVETKVDENVDTCLSADDSIKPVTDEVDNEASKTNNASNSDSQASLLSTRGNTSTNIDDFVPTIVGIRGAFESTAMNEITTSSNSKVEVPTLLDTSLQQINIVNVQGNWEKIPQPSDGNNEPDEVHIVNDCTDFKNAENTNLVSS